MNATTKKNTVPVNQKITCNTEELMQLLSCGRFTAVKIGNEADAAVRYGRTVLWNVKKVMDYVNRIAE